VTPGISASRWAAGSTAASVPVPVLGAGAAVGVHAPGVPDLCQVLLDPGGQGGDAGVAEGDLVQQHLRQLPMVVIEHAGQRLDQGVVLGFHPAAGQAGQDVGVALAADHRLDHVLRRDGGQLAGHRRHLDQRAFQQLFQPLPAAGPVLDQVSARPGVVAQHPDRRRRHERGAQHPHLGQPGQPHRVQPVGLGPPRQVPGLAGRDQLHRQPGAFQHVVPDPPVVRGRLQRHHLDPVGHQPVRQRQHRVHGGRHLPYRAVPGAGPRRVRRASAHHPRRLGHIDRGYPLKHPLVLLILDHLRLAHHGLLRS